MSFFQRVISYVANELLVNRLANRRGNRRLVSLSSPGALLTPGLPRSQYIFPTLRHQNRQDADRVAGYGCDHRPRNVAIFFFSITLCDLLHGCGYNPEHSPELQSTALRRKEELLKAGGEMAEKAERELAERAKR